MADVTAAFRLHHDAVYRYLVRLTGDADLAADAAQEAFVRLHRKPPAHDDQLRSWIYRVATNFAFDTLRVANRRAEIHAERPSDIVEPRSDAPDVDVEREERRCVVQRALSKLRAKEKAVLLMRGQGFSYREIGDALDLPVNSIGAIGARALRKLAKRLSPEEVFSQ